MVDEAGVFSFVSVDTDPTIQVRKLIAENTKRHSKTSPSGMTSLDRGMLGMKPSKLW